jgi:hypothetical protein
MAVAETARKIHHFSVGKPAVDHLAQVRMALHPPSRSGEEPATPSVDSHVVRTCVAGGYGLSARCSP